MTASHGSGRCGGVGRPYLPFYGPCGDIRDTGGREHQFRAAVLLACVGAWWLHPVQIEIAKKVFPPDPDEVRCARNLIEAIPDGRGVHMIDSKIGRRLDLEAVQGKVMVTPAHEGAGAR
jgi:malyl-CoA/(S)-citramalyl-CoA lyase